MGEKEIMFEFRHQHVPLLDIDSQTNEDGTRFYELPDGSRLPSVTTVLGARPKPKLEEWKKRVGSQEANRIVKISSGRGRGLHSITESFLKNEHNIFEDAAPDAKEMFLSIRPHLMLHVQDILIQEKTIYSKNIGMAGKPDLIAYWDGVLSTIDFKNARRTRKEEWITDYFLQTTAYSLIVEDMLDIPVKQVVILMAVEHEKPQIFVRRTRDYIPQLVEAIKYYKEHKLLETA